MFSRLLVYCARFVFHPTHEKFTLEARPFGEAMVLVECLESFFQLLLQLGIVLGLGYCSNKKYFTFLKNKVFPFSAFAQLISICLSIFSVSFGVSKLVQVGMQVWLLNHVFNTQYSDDVTHIFVSLCCTTLCYLRGTFPLRSTPGTCHAWQVSSSSCLQYCLQWPATVWPYHPPLGSSTRQGRFSSSPSSWWGKSAKGFMCSTPTLFSLSA